MLPVNKKDVFHPHYHHFDIGYAPNTHISDAVLGAIRLAFCMVWTKHIGKPGHFRVIIGNEISNQLLPEKSRCSGAYIPKTDTILLATDPISKRYVTLDLPLNHRFFLVAAHEAMHKVQYKLGDIPPHRKYFSEKKNVLGFSAESIHEIAAEQEALDAYKYYYPPAAGSFQENGILYHIPQESSYSTLFAEDLLWF